MWFLWLAGFVLEDAWGRPLYLLVYLAAGVVGNQFHAWANPGSIVPSVGASGAIAGLMGAFLVRFPKMKIRMMWFFDLGLFPFCRFWMRAYWLLPIWVLMEINYGTGTKRRDWTLGARRWIPIWWLAAVALRYSGLEHKLNKAIEEKVAWTPDPEITQAGDLMDHSKLDEAAATLNNYLTTKPDSVEAWNLLRAVYWRASNIPAYREATGKLCELHLKANESEAAWQDYEDFLNAGGERIPPDVWLDLCRVPEQQRDFERAVSEYEKLAAAYPSERQSVMAQLGAARICLKRLNRPQDALTLYEGASASAVPHLDLEQDIAIRYSGSQKCARAGQGILRCVVFREMNSGKGLNPSIQAQQPQDQRPEFLPTPGAGQRDAPVTSVIRSVPDSVMDFNEGRTQVCARRGTPSCSGTWQPCRFCWRRCRHRTHRARLKDAIWISRR